MKRNNEFEDLGEGEVEAYDDAIETYENLKSKGEI